MVNRLRVIKYFKQLFVTPYAPNIFRWTSLHRLDADWIVSASLTLKLLLKQNLMLPSLTDLQEDGFLFGVFCVSDGSPIVRPLGAYLNL